MALINWSANLSVNVPEMDRQHQKLIGMVNELHQAMINRQGRMILASLLTKLVTYTTTHFKQEEEFMQSIGFTGLEEHRGLHQALANKAATLKKRVDSGEASVTIEVMSFLEDWLKNHIMGYDRQYGQHAAKAAAAK